MKNRPRLLVVDDDANLRKTLSDILRFKGYDVATAGSGADGIAEAAREFVNVALIDLRLPDMSGLEVMERIKAAAPQSEAIILTGHASLDSALEATNKGAFSYLLKPYELDDLMQHIRHALERQLGQQEIIRLASFPRMNPNPVIEINADGQVTYLNPAAEEIFPGQALMQSAPPELVYAPAERGLQRSVRETVLGSATYQQFSCPIPGSDRIRIYMLDITELKAHETRLKRLNVLLLAIRNINEYLLAADSEEALFRFVCETLKGLDGVVGAIVAIKVPGFALKPAAWSGFSVEMMSSLHVRWDDSALAGGLMGVVAREGKPMAADDLENDPRYLPWREIVKNWNLKSCAAAPLIVDAEVLGVLAVYSGQRDAFDGETISFLAEVAIDVAVGVRTLRLGERLRASLENLRKSLDGTVEAIMRIVELRDPDTAGHARRVAQLACAIGNEMHLPPHQVEGLRVAGYLHDIGMSAVPAEMLSKNAPLSAAENEIVQSHPRRAHDILKNLEFPWPVADAILQHQERMDGSGYPQGLKGGQILLESRIVGVADVVDAMTSHRPYRPALGIATALDEIRSGRDSRYDAAVADACIRLFTERGFAFSG